MTSSGTNNFAPSLGELTLYSYGLCGIRRTEILQEHLMDARIAVNLMLAEWDNSTPNLWKVDLVSLPLVQGVATYSVDPSCIMVLDTYIRTDDGTTAQNDRIITPISRTEYASMPTKTLQARPTSFWFDRLLAPTITFWQTPDGNGPYLCQYYRVTQIFDANLPNGETADVPVIWLSAFAYGLAARLADTYAPDKADRLQLKADKALQTAHGQNVEDVNLYIFPALSGYFTR